MPTEYGIRPYANMVDDNNEETPYIDMMKAPTWAYALAQEVQKFSEFMKPYMADGDYPDMESNWPSYSFDGPNFGDPISPGPLYPMGTANPDKGKFQDCPCCFDLIWNDCEPESRSGGRFAVVFSKYPYNPATHHWTLEGDYKDVIRTPPVGTGWGSFYDSILFKFDPAKVHTNGYSYVDLTYTILGVCSHTVEMWAPCGCCLLDSYVAMTFDNDSTPDTVARSNSIACYVLNGCGPYTWAVSGTGFTFTSSTTSGLTNTLNADGTACGTATCTVTDDCGTIVTFYILCTTGTWTTTVQCAITGAGFSSSCGFAGCTTGSPVVSYVDNFRWTVTYLNLCLIGYTPGIWAGASCSVQPPCGSPAACNANTCTCGGPAGECVADSAQRATWTC